MALLAKFGVLAVKAIAKPLASRFKAEAVNHPGWRNVCLYSGRFVNQVTSRIDVYVLNSNKAMKNVKIKPLTEDQAVKTGADFISEFGLVMLALGLYGAETVRKERLSATGGSLCFAVAATSFNRVPEITLPLPASSPSRSLPSASVFLLSYYVQTPARHGEQ